jgi:hypothetical protein
MITAMGQRTLITIIAIAYTPYLLIIKIKQKQRRMYRLPYLHSVCHACFYHIGLNFSFDI